MVMRFYLLVGLLLLGGTAYFVVVERPPTVQVTPMASEVSRLQAEGVLPTGSLAENEEVEHSIFEVPARDEEMLELAIANMDMGGMDMGGMDMGGMDMGESSGVLDMDMDGDGVMDMSSADMPGDGTMDMDMDGDGVMDMSSADMPGNGTMDMDMDGDGVMDMSSADMPGDGTMDMDMDGDGVMDMSSADMPGNGSMEMSDGDGAMEMTDGDGAMEMAEPDHDEAKETAMGEADHDEAEEMVMGDADHDEAEEMAGAGHGEEEEEAERLMAGRMAGLIIRDDGEFDREISLSMMEWGFSDLEIDASAGERIKVTLRNDGRIPHEFMFMSMAAMQAVNYRAKRADWNLLEHEALYEKSLLLPGEEVTFVAEVTKPGAWMFMCMLPYHMQMGMMGQMATEGMAMDM